MTMQPVSHEESLELAGLYVLDALTPDEKVAVDAHLEDCPEEHPDYEDLGGVAPALAMLAEPISTPAALKSKVMASYRAEVGAAPDAVWSSRDVVAPAPVAQRSRMPGWLGWAAAAAAVLVLAVVGLWALNTSAELDKANQQATQISQAVAAMAAPGAQVAILHGSGPAAGVSGFAAFPPTGTGYMVLTDVPAAPSGMTYQAWYIVDGTPTSAGTMTADADGNVVAAGLQPMSGTDVVAVTVEPAGGSDQPTSQPIIVGDVTTQTAGVHRLAAYVPVE